MMKYTDCLRQHKCENIIQWVENFPGMNVQVTKLGVPRRFKGGGGGQIRHRPVPSLKLLSVSSWHVSLL